MLSFVLQWKPTGNPGVKNKKREKNELNKITLEYGGERK